MAAIVEQLEDRTLLSEASIFPYIAGDYTIDGLAADIDQDGYFDLTLTNEFGSVSSGNFLSETQIVAHDWEGGLVGDLYDGWIGWANGTVWFDDDATPDSTDYSINGGVANTLRDGNALVFTNELGDVSQGYYLSGTEVYATDWEGGLTGDIVDDRIEWWNGTTWTMTVGVGLGAPQFDPDWFEFVADEDAAIGTVLGTLTATDPQGQAVSYALSDPAGGSVPFAVDAAGTITVDAALDYDLQSFYSLEATASDTEGNTSIAATVEVYVNESTIPQAASTSRTTLHDVSLTDSIVWDATDDDGDELTFIIDTLPANGTLYDDLWSPLSVGQTFDGNFTFAPNASFVGVDGFDWHANDGDYDSNVATLTIDVYNTTPQAWDSWYETSLNASIFGDLNATAYDEDDWLLPGALTFTVQTLPAAGTLYDAGGAPLAVGQSFDGQFEWMPPEDYVGTADFTWSASDGIDESEIATVHLEVAPDYNGGPLVANDDIGITERGTPTTISVLENDGSIDGMLLVTEVTQGAQGTVTHDNVEITYTPTDPLFYGHDSFQYKVEDGTGAFVWATVDVHVGRFDLDVNNDDDLADSVDGAAGFLPGYVGPNAVLHTGSTFKDADYVGQKVRLILEGVGSDAGVKQVTFDFNYVTMYPGYSGNTTDDAIKGQGKQKDVSFSNSKDVGKFVVTAATAAAEGAELEADRVWAHLWIKDYAAFAEVRATLHYGGGKTRQMILKIPLSKEVPPQQLDYISDQWEADKWDEYKSVFGVSGAFDLDFFFAQYDAELNDPDGAGPATTHKAGGDELSVLQEYRGFILDGGGFAPDGTGGHTAGKHIRLSPAHKELLVEVDSMRFVPWFGAGMPEVDGVAVPDKVLVTKAMDKASKGFSNGTDGASIRMYYVLDQLDLDPAVRPMGPIPKGAESKLLAGGGRWNRQLQGEFVHLILATQRAGDKSTVGITYPNAGSIVYVKRLMDEQPTAVKLPKTVANFESLVSNTIAHELTHAIVVESLTNGFDEKEHVPDGDEDGTPDEVKEDGIFLMSTSKARNVDGWTKIKFSKTTIKAIDLTNSER